MPLKKKPVWLFVADGGRAYVIAPNDAGRYARRADLDFTGPHKRDRDIGADKPGRLFRRAGASQRDTAEPKSSLSRAAEKKFLIETFEAAAAAVKKAKAGGLVVVAPPRALGDLRAGVGGALPPPVVGELAFDLVKQDVAAIVARARDARLI